MKGKKIWSGQHFFKDQKFDLWPCDHNIKSIWIIYSLGASTVQNFATFKQRGKKILSGDNLDYRQTNRCKTIFPLFSKDAQNTNKRSMGHTAHLRKQFNSINKYDYIITLMKRRKNNIINFMRIYCFFIWRNLNPLHPKMLCAKIVWNWLSGYGEEDFLISSMYFHYFVFISPCKGVGGGLNLNKLESPSPMDALCQVWMNLAPWFWRRRLLNFVNAFSAQVS